MTRRRRPKRRHRRAKMLGVPAATAVLAWAQAGHPARAAGLAVAVAAAALVLPVVVLVIATTPSVLPKALVPRRVRIWWRGYGKSRPPRWARKSFARKQPPARLRRMVMAADRGRCVACKSRVRIELDHLLAYAAGGLDCLFNFMLLCKVCNDIKSNYNVDDRGVVHYHPWGGFNDADRARRILARERRARWNLLRWWRAALTW